MLLVAQAFGGLPDEDQDTLQLRRECLPIGFRPGPRPDRLGQGARPGELGDQPGRQLRCAIIVTPGEPEERVLLGVGFLRFCYIQQTPRLLGGQRLVGQAAHRRELLGAEWDAALRHVRLLVPVKESRRGVQIADGRQSVSQKLQRVIRCVGHGTILASPVGRIPGLRRMASAGWVYKNKDNKTLENGAR
jgi:hypothetical protein